MAQTCCDTACGLECITSKKQKVSGRLGVSPARRVRDRSGAEAQLVRHVCSTLATNQSNYTYPLFPAKQQAESSSCFPKLEQKLVSGQASCSFQVQPPAEGHTAYASACAEVSARVWPSPCPITLTLVQTLTADCASIFLAETKLPQKVEQSLNLVSKGHAMLLVQWSGRRAHLCMQQNALCNRNANCCKQTFDGSCMCATLGKDT